jgi:alkylglycerol monooxygenase
VNPQYHDRNYAGALIIWDRMFGTFEPEFEPVVYGITTPLASWNPVWANVHIFADILRNATRTRAWRDKWRVVFGHPGFLPADLAVTAAPKMSWPMHAPQFDPVVPRTWQRYAAVQFLTILVAAYLTLVNASTLATHEIAAMLFFVTLGLANVGAFFEGRVWVYPIELARLVTIAVAASAFLLRAEHRGLAVVALVVALLSALWLIRRRDHLTNNPNNT